MREGTRRRALTRPSPMERPSHREAPLWHVAIDGAKHGPYSIGQLQDFVAAGRVDERSLAWCKGMDNWEPAGQIEALGVLFEAPSREGITVRAVRSEANSMVKTILGGVIAGAALLGFAAVAGWLFLGRGGKDEKDKRDGKDGKSLRETLAPAAKETASPKPATPKPKKPTPEPEPEPEPPPKPVKTPVPKPPTPEPAPTLTPRPARTRMPGPPPATAKPRAPQPTRGDLKPGSPEEMRERLKQIEGVEVKERP